MIPKECKRLAEVDFPIAAVSAHSAREKSIRHGHPSTLHLWWARRPLAACRSMLMALLLPDPCDPNCPEQFKSKARRILLDFPGRPGRWDKELDPKNGSAADAAMRRAILHEFIADFANWDNAANPAYLKTARALVKAAHGAEAPLVVDPFAGGGSIPLEALRIGCDTFASDLNPVACLINKVLLEDIPRHGPKLAEELRRVGAEIKSQAERELAEFYPCLPAGRRPTPPTPGKYYVYVLECADGTHYKGQTDDVPRRLNEHEAGRVEYTSSRLPVILVHEEELDSREAAVEREKYLKSGSGREWLKAKIDATRERPIAYLWARTVRCEQPNCGCEIPLIRSWWLCKNDKRGRALRCEVVRLKKDDIPQLTFEVFTPTRESEVSNPTVSRANATCLCCGMTLPADRVRAQLIQERGGANVVYDANRQRVGGTRMLAVVTIRSGEAGRHFRLPTFLDYETVWKAQERLKSVLSIWDTGGKRGLCPIPDEPIDIRSIRNIWVMTYGLTRWSDVFTARQLLALATLVQRIGALTSQHRELRELLACAFSIFVRSCNGHARIRPDSSVAPAFGRHALPMTWTFPETVLSGGRTEHFDGAIGTVANALAGACVMPGHRGQVQQANAAASPLPSESCAIWFTDPPYYDAVAYAYLSDFFYVWIRRTLAEQGSDFLRESLVPKDAEIVVDRPHRLSTSTKDAQFYEKGMAKAFAEGRRVLREDGVSSVVFAHKTTEGWEALLSGMIQGGLTITGSWPIATENASRLNARDTASLATSVHLVCRPRDENAGVGDWGEIIRELPRRIGDWMERLSGEGIRGADLVFACIGPALELFSRYARVETPDGEEVSLAANDKARGEPARRGFLSYVWEFAGRTALNQVLGSAESRARLPAGRHGNGAAGALEEDARLTALFLWTLQATEAAANAKAAKKAAAESEADDETDDEDDDPGEETTTKKGKSQSRRGDKKAGLSLIYDVARRFAQPLGIHLDVWEGRIIETTKGVVRLLPVGERAKQLFGEDGASAVVRRFESAKKPDPQGMLDFMAEQRAAAVPEVKGRGRKKKGEAEASPESLRAKREATTLDRVHAAMLLQASGATNALRALLEAEVERGPDFLRLANALSALYPRESEEKRLLDAMLLAVPR